MAGKSRRVASRQGELSRRRKRGQRGPSGIPAVAPQPQTQRNGGATAVAVEAPEATTASPATENVPAPAPQTATASVATAAQSVAQSRGQGRTRGERPAAYNYVGSELRRIGLLSTVVVAALIVISVLL